jgi:hypothetical protein
MLKTDVEMPGYIKKKIIDSIFEIDEPANRLRMHGSNEGPAR